MRILTIMMRIANDDDDDHDSMMVIMILMMTMMMIMKMMTTTVRMLTMTTKLMVTIMMISMRITHDDDADDDVADLAERRRNCALTPLATSQQHNQGPLSPARLRRLRLLLDANLDRHSSEEELERISCGDTRKWVSALPQRHADHHSGASSDEEVRDLCGCGSPAAPARPLVEPGACLVASPSPVLFSSSPPRSLKSPMRFQLQVVPPATRPIILTHFEQSAPYRKYRHSFGGELGRPSLDLEKMQQVGASKSTITPPYGCPDAVFLLLI